MTEFRKARSDGDIEEIERLAREIWTEYYVPIIGQGQVDYMVRNFQSAGAIADQLALLYEYYLVLQRDRSAGYFCLAPGRTAQLVLSKIYIRKDLRGQGLGKDILKFVEILCRKRGITSLRLSVNRNNSRSIAWYERMGFRKIDAVVQDIGGGFVMDDFVMEKKL